MKYSPTPAPWSLGSNGASTKVVDAEGKAVCMVTPRKGHWNGDLLAAAPDVLAALRNVIASYRANDPDSMANAVNDAEAAIAKATGEAA
jgi:hypothetical protein